MPTITPEQERSVRIDKVVTVKPGDEKLVVQLPTLNEGEIYVLHVSIVGDVQKEEKTA